MMRFSQYALCLLLLVSVVLCGTSRADTLKLLNTSNHAVGGVYIYPYNFSFDGSSTSTPMMCINYDDEVTVGEQWYVQGQTLSTSSSTAFKEDAFIFSQLGSGQYSNSAIQFAVWDILDPGVGGNPGLDSTARTLVQLAQNAAPNLNNSFLNQFEILAPTADQTGWTAGRPQSYIVQKTALTPEPSSLLLLGTGFSGVSALVLRRRTLRERA